MFRVGIDIGGTFTDCVVQKPDGATIIVKSPSTPGDFAQGFMNALKVAAERFELGLADFLGRVDMIVHGTTVSTNALVTRRTAPTGLIATRGHPDVLTLREAPRKKAWDWRLDYPEPFVPRNRTLEVGGRIDSLGKLLNSLSYRGVLARGYAVVTDQDGTLIRSASAVASGQPIGIEFSDGSIAAHVDSEYKLPPLRQRRRRPRPPDDNGQQSLF